MPARSSLILRILVAVSFFGAWWSSLSARAITIDVRLMCETTGGCVAGDFFFDHPEALSALRFAAKAFEPFADQLSAIPASPAWTAIFTDPDTGATGSSLNNLAVPAETVILFAGGRDLPGNQVGEAGPGSATILLSRGQGTTTGPSADDFALWGGSIAFDTLNNGVQRNWHFDPFTSPGPGQVDFLSIAFHELAHVFGFGTAPSFDNQISGNQFQGATVVGLNGAPVALTTDNNHWSVGTTSPPYADEPASALTASLTLGRRTPLTPLDYAMFADVGWDVPLQLLGVHGDNNLDGKVDGRDFLLWQRGFETTGNNLDGDANEDNKVDDYDLWLWQQNHGKQLAAGLTVANIQVPEPSVCVMVLCAMTLAAAGRPRFVIV